VAISILEPKEIITLPVNLDKTVLTYINLGSRAFYLFIFITNLPISDEKF
jgi:hypothetical protein